MYKIILPSEQNATLTETPVPISFTQTLNLNAPISMEVNFPNRSICVLEKFEIFCYDSGNFDKFWKLPSPDFFPAFESEFLR